LKPSSQSDRNGNPSISRKQRPENHDAGAKGPDPAEFENAFVIDDESGEPSRAGTPSIPGDVAAMGKSNLPVASGSANGSEKGGETSTASTTLPSNGLSQEVRTKLRRLETLESKYKGGVASKNAFDHC
jgi:hypothetical protein